MKTMMRTLVIAVSWVVVAAFPVECSPFSENTEVTLNGKKGFNVQGAIGSVLVKAKSYPEGSSRDWFLAQSFSLAGNLAEIIRLAQACSLTSNRDAILAKGLGRAKNVQDVIALAKACGYSADRTTILIKGIRLARNVDEIIALANACPDRFDADAILARGARLVRSPDDLTALAQARRPASNDENGVDGNPAETSGNRTMASPSRSIVSTPEPVPVENRVVPQPAEVPMVSAQNEGKELVERLQSEFGVTMHGVWPVASLRAIVRLFSILPVKFRQSCKVMFRETANGPYSALGSLGSPGRITVYDSAFKYYSHTAVEVIAHEITHNFQGNLDIVDKWRAEIRGPSVSAYGNSNALEDMAESVRVYIFSPAKMKREFPSRYQFVKNFIMDGMEFTGKELKE